MNIMLSKTQGGVERAFLDYTFALHQAGIEVITVVNQQMPISYLQTLHQQQVPIYQLSHRFGSLDYPFIWKLRSLIRQTAVDLVIAHTGKVVNLVCRAGKKLVPIIGVDHSNNIKHMTECDGVLVVNHTLQKMILQQPSWQGKVFVIPNMLSYAIPDISATKSLTLAQSLKILFLGRLAPEKHVEALLYATAICRQHNLHVELFIGGDGPEKQKLHQFAETLSITSCVHFLGWIQNPADIFAKVDIFCLPSRTEPFGIAVLEAMSYRKVVVATETVGSQETIIHEQTGLIVPNSQFHDVVGQNLATAFLRLQQFPQLAQQLADNGYRQVKKHNTANAVGTLLTTALIAIQQDVITRKKFTDSVEERNSLE